MNEKEEDFVRRGTDHYYTQLGCGNSSREIGENLASKLGVSADSVTVEIIRNTCKETRKCPTAKWVLEPGPQNKALVLIKRTPRKVRMTSEVPAFIVVVIVVQEVVDKNEADVLYEDLRKVVPKFGVPTDRSCAKNANQGTVEHPEDIECFCQGDGVSAGASYTWGCRWSAFTGGCLHAVSSTENLRLFRLKDPDREEELGRIINDLADVMNPFVDNVTPEAFHNMTKNENPGTVQCRLGSSGRGLRPFSAVVINSDFATHPHRDTNNVKDGVTLILSLLRPDDDNRGEQLHVLPGYVLEREDHIHQVGGVGLRLPHGSVLLECAGLERHATTALPCPDRFLPSRLSAVYFRHHGTDREGHGRQNYLQKLEELAARKEAERIERLRGEEFWKKVAEENKRFLQAIEEPAKSDTDQNTGNVMCDKNQPERKGSTSEPENRNGPAEDRKITAEDRKVTAEDENRDSQNNLEKLSIKVKKRKKRDRQISHEKKKKKRKRRDTAESALSEVSKKKKKKSKKRKR